MFQKKVDPELSQLWYEPIYKSAKHQLITQKDAQLDKVIIQSQLDLLDEIKQLEALREDLKEQVKQQKIVEI